MCLQQYLLPCTRSRCKVAQVTTTSADDMTWRVGATCLDMWSVVACCLAQDCVPEPRITHLTQRDGCKGKLDASISARLCARSLYWGRKAFQSDSQYLLELSAVIVHTPTMNKKGRACLLPALSAVALFQTCQGLRSGHSNEDCGRQAIRQVLLFPPVHSRA